MDYWTDRPNWLLLSQTASIIAALRARSCEETHENLKAFIKPMGLFLKQTNQGKIGPLKEYDGRLGGKEGNAINK